MDKRYQVFVSSTYQDLLEERQEIMQALLELDCIPSGMELFPAANEDQWTLIKRLIDDCDYYIVVIANRYGSLGVDGISFTEMEYRYALTKDKPILGFIHKRPGSISIERSEPLPEGVKKLGEFRNLVQSKTIKFWETPKELGSVVSRGIVQLIKNNPATGWVRADAAANELAAPEILRLRNIIDRLNSKLLELREEAPKSAEDLAQGEEEFIIKAVIETSDHRYKSVQEEAEISVSWDEIINIVGPHLINDLDESDMKNALNHYAWGELQNNRFVLEVRKKEIDYSIYIDYDQFQTIKIQLMALGIIERSKKVRSVKDVSNYWILTPFGETTLNRLRAVHRSPPAHS